MATIFPTQISPDTNSTAERKMYSLIDDVKAFELEWGTFGDGLRNADYFITLSSLQQHIKLWNGFLNAVINRLKFDIESASKLASNLRN